MSRSVVAGSIDCAGTTAFHPKQVFHDRVRRFFKGELKTPFNHAARAAAGLPAHYYEPLAEPGDGGAA